MALVLETRVGPICITLCGIEDSYILDWCPWRDPTDLADPDRPRNPDFHAFNSRLHRAYSGHAVAAWDGTILIAILTFHPAGAINPPEGWPYPRPCGLSAASCLAYSETLALDLDTRMLTMGCVGLHVGTPRYRRQGIATAMAKEALAWAAAQGYKTARAHARPDGGTPEQWDRNPDPAASFWCRLGFVETGRDAVGNIVLDHRLAPGARNVPAAL